MLGENSSPLKRLLDAEGSQGRRRNFAEPSQE